MKQEHIDNLSRGKRSGANIGSRKTPHHLYTYEQEKYERAMKYKYLEITTKDRPNLENIWQKVCETRNWNHYTLIKNLDLGTAEILLGGKIIANGETKDMKQQIKTLI